MLISEGEGTGHGCRRTNNNRGAGGDSSHFVPFQLDQFRPNANARLSVRIAYTFRWINNASAVLFHVLSRRLINGAAINQGIMLALGLAPNP